MAFNWDEGGRYRALKTAAGVRPFSGPPGRTTLQSTMVRIGAILKARQQKAFVDQRRGNTPWKPRAVPNVAGIIDDLAQGRRPPARRWEDRPAGIDRGNLWQSIAFQLVGHDTVEVGSRKGYAGLIHAGGTSETPPIDETVRRNLYKYLYGSKAPAIRYRRTRKDENGQKRVEGFDVIRREAKKALGWIFAKKFRGQPIKIQVPARPFATLEDEDIRVVLDLVGVTVSRAR